MSYIQIQWTASHLEEARKIAGDLLEKKRVACVHILPPIESLFSWKGSRESQQEILVFFKTKASHFEFIKEYILENASYEVPEILEIPILRGNESYLAWINEVTS